MQSLILTLKVPTLESLALWLAVSYLAVIIAMAADFVAGRRKAHQAGQATTSRALKMTVDKATKYFLPMLCLSCIDLLTSPVLPLPLFTMLMAAFNILCEWKSVLESTHDKQALREAANTFNVIVKNKDDIAALITEAIAMMTAEHKHDDNHQNP